MGQGAAAAAAAARMPAAEGGAAAARLAEGAAALLQRTWEAHLRAPPHGLPGEGRPMASQCHFKFIQCKHLLQCKQPQRLCFDAQHCHSVDLPGLPALEAAISWHLDRLHRTCRWTHAHHVRSFVCICA